MQIFEPHPRGAKLDDVFPAEPGSLQFEGTQVNLMGALFRWRWETLTSGDMDVGSFIPDPVDLNTNFR